MTDNGQTPAASAYTLPPLGQNPSTGAQGTTPGSFAKPPVIAPGVEGAYTFASPDTPGMPEPSDKTAWDFLPDDWFFGVLPDENTAGLGAVASDSDVELKTLKFEQSDGSIRLVVYPADFKPVTQLEHARLGNITPEMSRVAEREPHLTAVLRCAMKSLPAE